MIWNRSQGNEGSEVSSPPHLDGVDDHPKQRYGRTNAPIALENISMMTVLMVIMMIMTILMVMTILMMMKMTMI